MIEKPVSWSHWLLREDTLYLSEAVCLLFEVEPLGEKNLFDDARTGSPPHCPPNMPQKRYEDMISIYFLAFVNCDNYRQYLNIDPKIYESQKSLYEIFRLRSLKSEGPRHRYKVTLRDFLQWAIINHDRIRIPDKFSPLIKKLKVNPNLQTKTLVKMKLSELYSGYGETHTTKDIIALKIYESGQLIPYGGPSVSEIRELLKGMCPEKAIKGGRPKKTL